MTKDLILKPHKLLNPRHKQSERTTRQMATIICPLPTSYPIYILPVFFFIKPFSKRQILDASKLKKSTDDYFKFEENG